MRPGRVWFTEGGVEERGGGYFDQYVCHESTLHTNEHGCNFYNDNVFLTICICLFFATAPENLASSSKHG